jgi:hypothetical protein
VIKKKNFPVDKIRRFLEPAPIILISSTYKGERDISPFIFEVVKAHVAASPKYPKTIHYRGDGIFMVSGRSVSYRRRFKRVNL